MMKKLSKLLALSMTAGMLLAACGETDDIENDLPDVEDTEEDLINDDLDGELEDDSINENMDEDTE